MTPKQQAKHTPTPWTAVNYKIQDGTPMARIHDLQFEEPLDKRNLIGELIGNEAHENAAFIVRAVNSHEALLEAAKEAERQMASLQKGVSCPLCLDAGDNSPWGNRHHANCAVSKVRKAIAQAEGKGE